MGLFKKIFKPVAKVLDKVIPNEIKPALPYLAAFAPVFGPASVQGFLGSTMGRRALTSGLLNIGAQLSQEGNEGDINLLSAGLGALSGAMTTPGAASAARGATTESQLTLDQIKTGKIGLSDATAQQAAITEGLKNQGILSQAKDFGLETFAEGSKLLRPGGEIPKLFSKEGLQAATLPAATATGDVMQAEARRLEKQAAIDAALAEAEALADSGMRGDAIRNAMRAYGFFTDDEIEETVSSAGYKTGGRVGFKFGGIDEAVEMVEEKTVEEGKEGIMTAAGEDPLLLEEYNKYVFDLLEQKPNAKPMSFQEFKRMIKAGMKEGGRVGLREGGVSVIEQITAQNFIPGLGRPGFQPTLQPGFARPLLSAGQMPVFPRLRELEQGIDTAESDLGSIRSRLGNQEGRLAGLTAIQPAFGLQPFARNPFLQNTLRSAIEPQGMKEGGLMNLDGKEMDLRGGGFVPIGKKEKADDVPARLSKNEFVMTADAVRAAGGGSVNKGAKRMYDLMNNLEARA